MLINEGNLVNLVQLLKQIHCSKFQLNLLKLSLSPVWITTGIFMQDVSNLFFSPHTTFNIYIHFFNEKILIYEPIYTYPWLHELSLVSKMETLKITKKHHKHLNNPFPSNPKSLPCIRGTLSFNPQTLPSHQIFCIGKNFQLTWQSKNGGSLSISHQSQPNRPIWSTIPGQAFVSAALAGLFAEAEPI